MDILSLREIRQIDEHRLSDGKLYAPVLSLTGHRTLLEIRDLLITDIIPAAQSDIAEGTYHAVFIEPSSSAIENAEADALRLWEESEARAFGQSRMAGGYLDQRGGSEDETACLHSHGNYVCTSALATVEGETPTTFFTNQEALRARLLAHAGRINDAVDLAISCNDPFLTVEHRLKQSSTVREITTVMTRLHVLKLPVVQQMLDEVHRIVFENVEHIHRFPLLGHISVFAGSETHSSNPYLFPSRENAGELLTDHWKQR